MIPPPFQSRALVVGYGRMGRIHAKVLADLGYTITTVDPYADADHPTIADAALGQFDRYDVAAIACPAEHLAEAAFQLAGTPMLVEKPFAPGLQQAAMLAAYLEQAGAPVCVGFTERFNPQVRQLAAIRDRMRPTAVRFVRYSDRPSHDTVTDLLIHDVDLASHLQLWTTADVTFDIRADQPEKARRIEIDYQDHAGTDQQISVDLMDHQQSPLHALWHTFLTGGGYPKPSAAVRALEILPHVATVPVAVA